MRKFILNVLKFSLIGIIPVIVLLIMYVIHDPFKIVRHYDNYSFPDVTLNRDFVSTESFLNKYKKNQYNSFVFGSSRTLGIRLATWKKHLSIYDHPFKFDASQESISGILLKIKLLDSLNIKIDNALLLFCHDVTFRKDQQPEGHLFISDPELSHKSRIIFHSAFLKAYFDKKFIVYYYLYIYKYHKTFQPFMKDYIEERKISYDPVTNEADILNLNDELAKNSTLYYEKRKLLFYGQKGETIDLISQIDSSKVNMLIEIRKIFDKHHTNYKIILSPLYEQVKFNSRDLKILNDIFENNVYDFTGQNELTGNKFNYYETSHFRPNVGDSIFKKIY